MAGISMIWLHRPYQGRLGHVTLLCLFLQKVEPSMLKTSAYWSGHLALMEHKEQWEEACEDLMQTICTPFTYVNQNIPLKK